MRLVTVVIAALAVQPIPIGVGPRYHPAAGAHGPCRAGSLRGPTRVHLEIFAGGRVVIVPAGIGVRGARLGYGAVVAARCHGALWTLEPTGVVEVRGRRTLGDLFAVWGRVLRPTRLLGFRGRVRLYRNGARLDGDVRRAVLRNGDELVLEVGRYVTPHRSFRFPP
jgi:hypothetical protein